MIRFAFVIAASILFASAARTEGAVTPVAANGKLRVEGTYLLNARGDTVQLRGVASHGMQWFNQFYGTGKAFSAAAEEWGADVLRLTIYLSEDGYLTNKKITRDQFDVMIDDYVKVCVQKGIYIILDWHVHKPGYPSYYQAQAKDFFTRMGAKYGALPNVLWEICNEPSSANLTAIQSGTPGVTDPGHYVTWPEIVTYAKEVIPLIKAHNPDAVILVGTPSWSSLGVTTRGNDAWKEIAANKIPFSNVLYVIHYYAGAHTHQAAYEAASKELPLFSTEWASSGFEDSSPNNVAKGQAFLDMLNRRKIGWCYWNYSDGVPATFAMFDSTTTADGPFAPGGTNITATGKLVYDWLSKPEDSWANYVPTALVATKSKEGKPALAWQRRRGLMEVRLDGGTGMTVLRAVNGRLSPQ
jgi:endoglucanase